MRTSIKLPADVVGNGEINFDDDIVAVYNEEGEVCYKGTDDYNPYRYDDWTWKSDLNAYVLFNKETNQHYFMILVS